jgi:cytochrome c553
MDLVARGLTDAQIREIAAYLATLPETKGND